MGCFLTDLNFGTYSGTLPAPEVPSKTSDGGPRLMISDNPENIGATDFKNVNSNRMVLWHHGANVSTTVVRHRVFGWHSAVGIAVKVGLTVTNTGSSPIRISNIKRRKNSGPSGNPIPVGRCLAEALLSDSGWDSFTPLESLDNIGAGQARVIDAYLLDAGTLVGFLFEFDIALVSGSASSYLLRTVATRTTTDGINELRAITSPLALAVDNHQRGGWGFGNIRLSQPYVYAIPSGGASPRLVTLNGGGANQIVFTASSSYDSQNARNNGDFGAIYSIPITFVNNDTSNHTVRIQIHKRGQDVYAGAAQKDTGNFAIPILGSNLDYAHLTDIVNLWAWQFHR